MHHTDQRLVTEQTAQSYRHGVDRGQVGQGVEHPGHAAGPPRDDVTYIGLVLNRRGLQRVMLGSQASEVLTRSKVPALIVR